LEKSSRSAGHPARSEASSNFVHVKARGNFLRTKARDSCTACRNNLARSEAGGNGTAHDNRDRDDARRSCSACGDLVRGKI
jgi:hypothetical protein